MKVSLLSFLIIFFTSLIGCTMPKKMEFYNSIYREDVNEVKNMLFNGANPNKCFGEAGWVDSNPLKIVTEGFKNTFYNNQEDNFEDVKIVNLLVQNGADINRQPYVWDRVFSWDNESLNDFLEIVDENNYQNKSNREPTVSFVNDANRVLEALLKNGADPNKKGHPTPYTHSFKLIFFTDGIADKYFNSHEATTPIFEAVKKGSIWESQVDLLLKYGAKIDESCLKAAELSGDAKMIEKVKKLLEDN